MMLNCCQLTWKCVFWFILSVSELTFPWPFTIQWWCVQPVMYEIWANKNLCSPTLANYLTDWTLLCVDTVKEPPRPRPPNKEATRRKKNSSVASLFYSLLEDYIFLDGQVGGELWVFRRGTRRAQAVMEGARTAVSGRLKRFSQAEIFNLLRENKAEKTQRTKRS